MQPSAVRKHTLSTSAVMEPSIPRVSLSQMALWLLCRSLLPSSLQGHLQLLNEVKSDLKRGRDFGGMQRRVAEA